MKRLKYILLFILTLTILILPTSKILAWKNPSQLAKYQQETVEFRAAWVATVFNLDMKPQKGTSEEAINDWKNRYLAMLDTLQEYNMNAIVFQIRPANDAFYPSVLNPYSKFMSGKEGTGFRNFDPLKFMISECHKRGIEFHAWMNPYRVLHNVKTSKAKALKELTDKNYAKRFPDQVLNVPGNDGNRLLILDPGRPEVRAFLLATVQELILNYNVDAVHFEVYKLATHKHWVCWRCLAMN